MARFVNSQPFVDARGNIQVQGRSGLSLTYQRLVAGVAQNISADALFFEIAGVARTTLGAGGDNETRTLVVESATIAELPLATPIAFALRDETHDPAIVRWDGFISVRGFTAEPT
jgi:hypothetical protein